MVDVVIDPGHGGRQPMGGSSPLGARGLGGSLEKDVTLEVARRLVERLLPRVRARLTRQGDTNLSLADRAAIAGREGARVFLSLHANSGRPGERGCETWVHERSGGASARSPGACSARSRSSRARTAASRRPTWPSCAPIGSGATPRRASWRSIFSTTRESAACAMPVASTPSPPRSRPRCASTSRSRRRPRRIGTAAARTVPRTGSARARSRPRSHRLRRQPAQRARLRGRPEQRDGGGDGHAEERVGADERGHRSVRSSAPTTTRRRSARC